MMLGSDRAYDTLVARFVPRVLHDDEQYAQVMAVIEDLLQKEALSAAESDYLALVTKLVAEYEAATQPMDDVSDVEMLRFLMQQHGLKQKDLVDVFKTDSIVSEVLSGKREMNKSHIEGLAKKFHVSPAVFFPTIR